MWADAKRDGRPAEGGANEERKFRNSLPCHTLQSLADAAARVPCSKAANTGERKTGMRSEFCTCQNSVKGQNVYIVYQPMQETAKHRAKFG